jgi:Concanavalin A-like lectin/glucanases superfamily
MKPERLEELIQRYIDGCLSAEERRELEELLIGSADARRTFWRDLRFEGLLAEAGDVQQVRRWMNREEQLGLEQMRRNEALEGSRLARALRWLLPLTVVAGAIVFALVLRSPGQANEMEPTSSGVAVLTGGVDVTWREPRSKLEPGAILPPGRLAITSGLIGLEFYGGARVALEGPAEIEVVASDSLICHRGRLRVFVPDRARGFRVFSPNLDLIDLGTEFGVEIDGESRTRLHVFTGKVELAEVRGRDSASAPRHLVSGQALQLDATGVSALEAQPGNFVGFDELSRRLRSQARSRHAVWLESMRNLRTDPRLVLHYDFEPDPENERSLANRSSSFGRALDGAVVGAGWTEGRWAGKGALEFSEPSDRIRTFVPGEYDAITLIAWIRADAFPTLYSSLLLTDGFNPGAVHWQFCRGQIRAGVASSIPDAKGRIGLEYDGDTGDLRDVLGRWHQVAVTIDMSRRQVVHYLDGRPVKRVPTVRPQRLVLGSAEIGNWGLPDKSGHQPIRNFRGRIDEFMVFNQALSDQEIAGLYEKGRVWPDHLNLARNGGASL